MNDLLTTHFVARTMQDRGFRVRRGVDRVIRGGSPDSRTVESGDLFAAFRGEHLDGNDFVAAAAAGGAVAVVCEREPAGLPEDLTVVVAPDTRAAMKELARAWRESCPAHVIGITGTVGKTTAKEAVASLLATRFKVHRSPGNMNSREGLPIALLTLHRDHQISVLEMAMDSPGEILELCEVARPDTGIVLNIGLTHVSKLGAPDAIEREKLSLVRYLGPESTAILNLDDPRLARATGTLSCRVLTFGSKATGADLTWTNARDQGLEGVRFDVRRGTGDWLDARSPLIGVHTLPAALTALAAGLVFGLDLPEAVAALAAGSIPGRLRVLAGLRGSTLLDDTYNSSPASLAGALNTLDSVRGEGTGRRLALLGPMAELGDFERQAHLEAGRVAAEYCDILVAVGEPCRALVEEAKASGLADTLWCDSKEEAARRLAGMVESGDVVLLKASRSTALETIVPVLAEGGAA